MPSQGLETAYSDKHPACESATLSHYQVTWLTLLTDDLVRGPSGQGLTTGYFPEMAADSVGSTVAATIAYDQLRAQAFLDYLDGIVPANSEGKLTTVPTVFGGNFQARESNTLSVTSSLPR
jgi:hypothetical protein